MRRLLLSLLIASSGCLHVKVPDVLAAPAAAPASDSIAASDNATEIALAIMPELLSFISLPDDPESNVKARVDLLDMVTDMLRQGKTDKQIIDVFIEIGRQVPDGSN